jgi:hypothetical protein
MKSALRLFAVVLVSGCATGRLSPVQGPLSSQMPPPAYRVKMDSRDAVTATLGKGNVCNGTCSDVVQEDPTARDMSAEWDLVYGKGFFLANISGKPGVARAILTCSKDTTVSVEFNSVRGVAKDNNGDVFKLTF